MSEWQPIETAPRDGTRLFLWDSHLDLAISGMWHVEPTIDNPVQGYEPGWAWWVSDRDYVMWDDGTSPTHWMPLPKPPQSNA
jgi:hypothetical protein